MYDFRPETEAKWESKDVSIVHGLREQGDDHPYDGLGWHAQNLPPDRVITRRSTSPYSYYSGLSPLWTEDPRKTRPTHVAGLVCPFPPQWNHLCGAQFDNYSNKNERATVWNSGNAVVQAVSAEAWTWCRGNLGESLDPLSVKGSLLIEKARAASWILMCLQAEQSDLWDGPSDRDPTFLPTLWKMIFGAGVELRDRPLQEVFEWVEDSSSSRLRVLTQTGWNVYRVYKDSSKIEEYLPDPGTDWTLVLDDERSRQIRAELRPRKLGAPGFKKQRRR